MTRQVRLTAAACVTAIITVAWVVELRLQARLLWPGARFTTADRDRAMRRGLFFLYSVARQPDTFRDWGHDLLSAFFNIASTNADRAISELAWRMGHERALAWRAQHRGIPAGADADDIANLVYGSDAAELLGVPDSSLHNALCRAAARFSAADYLGFDPKQGPPPADQRYPLFQDALINAYTFDHFGAPLGVHYADVLHWVAAMRPYPPRVAGRRAYYHAVYTVTHIVYTYNGYNQSRISPQCFPQEFAYLNANLSQAIEDQDPETLGEYLDSLQAFGLTWADARVRRGVESLLSAQNPDGSWGDPGERDMYARYHTTWTALGGIQAFRWTRVLPCPEGGNAPQRR